VDGPAKKNKNKTMQIKGKGEESCERREGKFQGRNE
jgi:hypothetical protein